jgi:hypothetical protein
MSVVELKGFASHKQGTDQLTTILFGAKLVQMIEQNGRWRIALTLSNVSLDPDVTLPQDGLLLLYGRDAIPATSSAFKLALEQHAKLQTVILRIEIGEINVGNVTLDDLRKGDVKFLSWTRLSVELQNDIYAYFSKKMNITDDNQITLELISSRPDLFEKLLEEDKDFQNIRLFVIPVKDARKIRYLAYVPRRAAGHLLSVAQGTDSALLLPPTWLERTNVLATISEAQDAFQIDLEKCGEKSRILVKSDIKKLAYELFLAGVTSNQFTIDSSCDISSELLKAEIEKLSS